MFFRQKWKAFFASFAITGKEICFYIAKNRSCNYLTKARIILITQIECEPIFSKDTSLMSSFEGRDHYFTMFLFSSLNLNG